ncbi:MAG: hypothetical protein NTY53_18635 [Kiritimatiellaeota bacterium]|nr:hypothetical protein [Kiritimatiellota bacterium]
MKHKRNPGLFWFSFLGLALGVLTAQAQTNFWWTNNASASS